MLTIRYVLKVEPYTWICLQEIIQIKLKCIINYVKLKWIEQGDYFNSKFCQSLEMTEMCFNMLSVDFMPNRIL